MLKDCDIDIQFHRQSLELAYFHQNTHKKNKDFEGGARAWESNLQAFQWDHQKPELLWQRVEVRPPFHNGELPRLLYICPGPGAHPILLLQLQTVRKYNPPHYSTTSSIIFHGRYICFGVVLAYKNT